MKVLGYPVQTQKNKYKAFDSLNPPALIRGSGRIKDTKPLAGMTNDRPLLVLDMPGVSDVNGAPVFEPSGKVMGLLYHASEKPYVVLADYIQELLP